MFMKKLSAMLLSAALAMSVAIPANAQSFGPAYTLPTQLQTYRAAIVALTPAASATDLFTISGVAGHTVQVRTLHCDGISTAAATALLQVVKRSSLDTGGTFTAPTSVRLNSNNPASAAILKAYTANPTLGTSIGVLAAAELTTNTAAASAINNTGVTFDFTNQNLFINEATTIVAINANATSLASGASLNCWVEWNEI